MAARSCCSSSRPRRPRAIPRRRWWSRRRRSCRQPTGNDGKGPAMAKAGYSLTTLAAVALVATTAKSVLTVIAPAQFGIDLTKIRLGFDGVTASAVPVLVGLCDNTRATNSTVGTGNTTAGAPTQHYSPALLAGFTRVYAPTSEPSWLTAVVAGTLAP